MISVWSSQSNIVSSVNISTENKNLISYSHKKMYLHATILLLGLCFRMSPSLVFLTWTEWLCSTIFTCWNPNSQYDDIWPLGLWELIRSWGWSPHGGISDLIGRDNCLGQSICDIQLWQHERTKIASQKETSLQDVMTLFTDNSKEFWKAIRANNKFNESIGYTIT